MKPKHDVRRCGCDFTKCPLLLGREKHLIQSQFQADSVSASFVKLETFFTSEIFTHLKDQ